MPGTPTARGDDTVIFFFNSVHSWDMWHESLLVSSKRQVHNSDPFTVRELVLHAICLEAWRAFSWWLCSSHELLLAGCTPCSVTDSSQSPYMRCSSCSTLLSSLVFALLFHPRGGSESPLSMRAEGEKYFTICWMEIVELFYKCHHIF